MQTWTNSQPTAAAVALAGAVAGDAVADPVEAAELLDVDVDQLAGLLALVAEHRRGRLQIAHPASRAARRMRLTVAGETPVSLAICLPVKRWRRRALDLLDLAVRGWPVQAVRPRGAIRQARRRLRPRSARPTCSPSWRHAEGRGHRLAAPGPRPAPAAPARLDYAASGGHSYGRSSGPPWITEASQPQLPRSGPDGQPIESSQLDVVNEESIVVF